MNKKGSVVLLLVLAAGCVSGPQDPYGGTEMDPSRRISEQDCSRPIDNTDVGNLMCRELTQAERRARAAEEERAARERLERERAARLAAEEAARKQRALKSVV